jgi:AraC family transcriptional regulator
VNRVVRLIQTDAVGLERFDHEPGVVHHDPERERAAGHRVNFVEAGTFRVRTTGAWQRVSGDRLFVTRPGLEFSCAHDEDHPSDCCLSVWFSVDAMESARSAITFSDAPLRALTNRHAFLRRAFHTCVPGDEARAEAIAGALLWSLAANQPRPPQPLFRPDRLAWYAARVERAKTLIEARYAEPLSLSAIARDSGISVFHFARIFADLEGQPPHRFLTDVRLTHAAARLRDGASVTETCFAVGFGSLSHFITVFRHRYGITPSRLVGNARAEADNPPLLRAQRGHRIDA